ncbi:MAG: hypothetical protein HYV09_12090 [Deltaproteobacteria bacterium]|nr:hypothetical protein [Deltaproteobacteria bacterium]
MRRVAFALVASLCGCSLESSGTSDDILLGDDTGFDASSTIETSVEDSTVDSGVVDDTGSPVDTATLDSYPADTSVADTFVADTFVPDTFVAADTYVADTYVADTYVADTYVADTYVADTADAPTTGFLACEATAPASVNVNLATEGTIDWAHWGHGGLASNWNRKSGASALVKGSIGSALWWGSYPTQFTWTGGTPTASVTNTNDGIYHQSKDATFQFDAGGSATAERTLKVYVSWNGGSGSIEAKMSDGSATTATSTIPPSGVTGGSGIKPVVYTCRFRPLTATGKLQIRVTQTTSAGYISLLAASLR